MTSARRPYGFRRRLAVAAVLLAAVPAGAVGYALIGVNQRALEATHRELLYTAIDHVAHQLDRTVDQAIGSLEAISSTLSDNDVEAGLRTSAAKRLVSASPSVTAVAIYDAAGAFVDAVREVGVVPSLPEQLSTELRPARDAAPTLGAVERASDGTAVLPVVAAIKLESTTWYAYAPISLASLDEAVATLAASSFAGVVGAVFVVDRQLRVIADGNPERPPELRRSSAAIVRDLDATPAGKQFLAFATYDSPAGPMIGAVRSLPSLPFAVVAQVPKARAFASIERMRTIVLGVVLASIALSAAVAWWLARRVSAPVGKLVRYAGDLAARRFDAPLDVRTGDELEVLGTALTDAAHALAASEHQLRRETAIRSDLGRYLPKQLVDRIAAASQPLTLGGQRRTVSVLFADVASFSTLVEQHPPEQVVTILNQLFTMLTEIVFKHGGTVDKFIGDCVMAFWNAPDDQPDHGARAVAASLEMLRWLEVANEAWQVRHGVTIYLAIGVHTGEVVVGNFGSETRMEYTCIGDAVNLAARLEAAARPLQILVSRTTRDAAGDRFDYRQVGLQRLPSRLEPVELFEVTP